MTIRKNQSRRDFIKKAGLVNAGLVLGLELRSANVSNESGVELSNSAGVKIQLFKSANGWGLGTISLNGQIIESQPMEGFMFLQNIKSGEIRLLMGREMKHGNPRIVRLSGSMVVDGVTFKGDIEVEVDENQAAIKLSPSWSVSQDLQGWEVCLTYHKSFSRDWRVQSYPFAGNSEKVDITPMRYCGVPGALVYNSDLSMTVLFSNFFILTLR